VIDGIIDKEQQSICP